MTFNRERFSEIDLCDPFFDSLKSDYAEFSDWFARKEAESAYVFRNASGMIDGFLYLKHEQGGLNDVTPPLPAANRIKVGTLKINAHGTRLGERFVKKIFDHAVTTDTDEIYVTVFEKHASLISLFERYGFTRAATKTTQNGIELVLVKKLFQNFDTVPKRYPLVDARAKSIYILALQPQWHTRLLPDSILRTEDASIVTDVSHTNSIHKVYLAAMRGLENLKPGDILLIYRTSDDQGFARYRSVVTSICVVEEYRRITTFGSQEEFVSYCNPYSVFTVAELNQFWLTKKYPHVIKFSYNFALPKRINRHRLLTEFGFNANDYWGFMPVSNDQFYQILTASNFYEDFIID